MAKKDIDMKGKGGVCECGNCRLIGWLLPILLLLIALVPGWLSSTWGKWVIVIIALLYIYKKFKPCKKCMAMK